MHKRRIDTQSTRVGETSEEKKLRKSKPTPVLRHSAYLAFQNIRQRCTNRNNKDFFDYGGRGFIAFSELDRESLGGRIQRSLCGQRKHQRSITETPGKQYRIGQ